MSHAVRTIVCKQCRETVTKRMRSNRLFCSHSCHYKFLKKRFCINGHDTEIVGRYDGNGGCIECARGYDRLYDRSPERRMRQRQKYATDSEYRKQNNKRSVSNEQKRSATIEGNRYRLLVKQSSRLRRLHLLAETRLEAVFAEVNEVLAG